MPDNSADLAVMAILNDAGLGWQTASPGKNLFRGHAQPFKEIGAAIVIPYLAAFCLATGGPPPRTEVAAGGGTDLREPTVQVTIRGNPLTVEGAFEEGQRRADDSWKVLQRATYPGFMSITIRDAAPVPIRRDDKGSPRWVFNVLTMFEQF